MSKFKIGDRVRLVDEEDYRGSYAGTVTQIIDPDPGGAEPRYVVREVPDSDRRWERFVESALTLDTEHDTFDMDDVTALRKELVDSVTRQSTYSGLYCERRGERIRAASRIAWLASRIAWLEACSVIKADDEAKALAAQPVYRPRVGSTEDRWEAEHLACGRWVRLADDRVIEADRYDPAVHGPRAECRDIHCGLVDRSVVHVDH